ncbi:MAG: HEAT repeat domain-containing protein [Sedimentisphaerales bacterium]|nr:HEAT repeat domain-containing protein [Sedimentisphaerales bacterium]
MIILTKKDLFNESAVDGYMGWALLSNRNYNELFNRVAAMLIRRLFLLILMTLLALAGCQEEITPEKVTSKSTRLISPASSETQLKINQETLYRGATEDVRIDAAMIMLFSDNPQARKILIDALMQGENKSARVAVCKALSASRETRMAVKNKRDFIDPLAEVLKTDEGATARAAAEAALLFEYDEIAGVLEPIVRDSSFPVKARLNVIYALKVQLDVRSITRLSELIDDKDPRISSAAADALDSIGVPVGKDPRRRAQILSELRTRGMERFQREWMIRQEARLNELEKQQNQWKKLYLDALDKIYAGLVDDGQRSKLLVEYLNSPEQAIRLWALEKVSQWRIGTQAKLPNEMGSVLVKLISDDDRNVRLAAAKLLSLTGELSSAERLAAQFSIEQDEEVKQELFVALGAACQYALVPTSGVQLSPELRSQTLDWAVIYLNDGDPRKAHKGAEVIRKLLEPGGLDVGEAAKYLDLLVARYKKPEQSGDGALQGDLLATMARLCGQNAYKPETARRFAVLFEQALKDESEFTREAAVDGLICIDKTRALKLLARDYVNDRSQVVRNRVIELAAEVGGKDDLNWLWDKVGVNAESKSAWQAMLRIFAGSDANVIESWFGRLESQPGSEKLTNEQRIAFFETAEKKANVENRSKMIRSVREKLAQLYSKTGQFQQAAEYLGKLRETAQTPEQREAALVQLLDVYLRWPKVDSAAWVISNCLLEKDLAPGSKVIHTVEAFWENPTGGTDPNVVLDALRKIQPVENRPMWEQNLARWSRRFQPAAHPNDLKPRGG